MGPAHADLVRAIRFGEPTQLYRRGCKLALQNKEFARREFGSRQLVYVLDDQHRLLRQSFVFKHTDRRMAEHEVSALEGFQEYLRITGAPEFFRLPEPIAILPLEDDQVGYVMRRARGEQLGQLVMHSPGTSETIQAYERAIRFLAYYHAWGVEKTGTRTTDDTASLVLKATRFFKGCGISVEDRNRLSRTIQDVIPPSLPGLLKKDAHPENWLIDAGGNVVMLDLETRTFCPVFFELAQLIDDYPFVEVAPEGWRIRMKFCETYADTLLSLNVNSQNYCKALPGAYEAFALLRAAFGLARNRTKARWSSSSAVRDSSVRDSHYLRILVFLSGAGISLNVRNCAALLESHFRRTI